MKEKYEQKYYINTVDEMFRWKKNEIRFPTVEDANRIWTKKEKDNPHCLDWECTDVLYSFSLMYYLGLNVTNQGHFNYLLEKKREIIKRQSPFSTQFLFECSKDEKFQRLNENTVLIEFLQLYFSIGNVIPIWPGGNEARGKMGIYDIPEIFFNKYPRWTNELVRQYPNAHLDKVVNNNLFFVEREIDSKRNLKGYKNAFENFYEFKCHMFNDEKFYYDYLKRRNNVIKERQKLLIKELNF